MVSVDKIRGLIRLFEKSDVCELEVKYLTGTVTITNNSKSNSKIAEEKSRKQFLESIPKTLTEKLKTEIISSPGIGTFYWNQQKENYHPIVEGEKISKGQVIGYIEAMNLFSEVKSDYVGLVKKVLIKNGDVIDFKQSLLELNI